MCISTNEAPAQSRPLRHGANSGQNAEQRHHHRANHEGVRASKSTSDDPHELGSQSFCR
jgi:hypothetical protein